MSELTDIHDAMPEGIAKEAVCILTNISQQSIRNWPVSPEQFAAQRVEVAKRIVALGIELAELNRMLWYEWQFHTDDYPGYDDYFTDLRESAELAESDLAT